MAAYLRFYKFDSSPFEIGNQKRAMVLGTHSLRGAFAQVKQGLSEDSPRICLSGSAGVGKTSFCRALPRLLGDEAQVAIILNPRRSWQEVRATIAKKFKLDGGSISRRALLDARENSKQLVLVIDEAESLNHESLDHLDILLQYKCDDGKQLLHCVMLADLDAASTGVEIPLLWWLDKLTTLQLQFSPIPAAGLRHYVEKHLAKAGWAGGELFTDDALEAIHRNTGGVPRAINELCEKILIEGGVRGLNSISAEFIEQLCGGSPQAAANPSGGSASELSADFSVGDFGTSPSAQELLDAQGPEAASQPETWSASDASFMDEAPEDLQSLIMTQDSAEALRVDPEPNVKPQPSLTIELEDDPTERKRDDAAFLVNSGTRPPVGMNRFQAGNHKPKRHGGRAIFALIIAGIAYAIYSQFSLPTQVIDKIEKAEVKITEALKRQPTTARAEELVQEPELLEVVEAEPTLPRSLLDRADELAAKSGLDKIPLPSLDDTNADATDNSTGAVEIVGDDTKLVSPSELETAPSASSVAGSAVPSAIEPTTPSTKPAAKPAAPAPTAAAALASKSTATVSEDIVIINEYTAIPEAASSAPKLAIPGTEKTASDLPASHATASDTNTKSPSPTRSVPGQSEATRADRATPMPAKLDAEPSAPPARSSSAAQPPSAIDTSAKTPAVRATVPGPKPEITEAEAPSTTPPTPN